MVNSKSNYSLIQKALNQKSLGLGFIYKNAVDFLGKTDSMPTYFSGNPGIAKCSMEMAKCLTISSEKFTVDKKSFHLHLISNFSIFIPNGG